MQDSESRDWRSEFTPENLAAVRAAIPQAIQNVQERSARAHTEYADPDGDQDVYGIGMARGGPKELQALLSKLPNYREERVQGTRRTLTYLEDGLIFLQRVGKKMPRNHRRLRLNYLPDDRRALFRRTSNKKYLEPGLFDLPEDDTADEAATLTDVLAVMGEARRTPILFVPYYSSTPLVVGTMFLAPARLSGHHLEFSDPERLEYVKAPAESEPKKQTLRKAGGFAGSERPKTDAKLRPREGDEKGNG
jgi:hypothetical protein